MEKNKNMLLKVIVAIFVLALVVGLLICGLKYFNKDNGSEDEEIVDILDSDERDKAEKGEYVPHVEDMDEPSNSETLDDDLLSLGSSFDNETGNEIENVDINIEELLGTELLEEAIDFEILMVEE